MDQPSAPPVSDPVRFVILAEGRSGSNWLVDLLNSCPGCRCMGEIFLDLPEWGPREEAAGPYMERKLAQAAAVPGRSHVGFKHLPSFDPEALRCIVADPRFRIILLRRRDRLAQYASETIARATNLWVAEGAVPDRQAKVPFVVRGFIDFCRAAEGWYRAEVRQLRAAGRPPLEITYEELVAGRAQARVLAHLGLPPDAALSSSHRRINSDDVYARFSNPRRARFFAPLIRWRPTRKLLRILRGIRPLRPLLD